MSIYLRGDIYWMDYRNAKGKLVRKSTGMKKEELALRVFRLASGEDKIGITPEVKTVKTLNDALERWYTERGDKRSIKDDRLRGGWWQKRLGKLPLKQVTAPRIRDEIEVIRRKNDLAGATCNRYLALIRSVLRCCEIDWGWLEAAPRLRGYPSSSIRVRYLELAEITRLSEELPEHLRDLMIFSTATGLRQGNACKLQWEWVNMNNNTVTIPASAYKTKETVTLPLNATAQAIVQRQLGKHREAVFTYEGRPIGRVNGAAWKKALARAGIKDFRWHDLRHTFASWHVMNGTPLNVIQVLGGWKNASMVQKYAHLSVDSLRRYDSNSCV